MQTAQNEQSQNVTDHPNQPCVLLLLHVFEPATSPFCERQHFVHVSNLLTPEILHTSAFCRVSVVGESAF
jgi:hypothetical protein